VGALEELRKHLERSISADDLVEALFARLKASEISKDPGKLHKALFSLNMEEKPL